MIFETFIKPVLFREDPEAIHEKMIGRLYRWGNNGFLRSMFSFLFRYDNSRLRTRVGPLKFSNPIGLAAGFDKNARTFSIMPSFGFGFVEVGTVTGQVQEGNPKPRMFRLTKDNALINRLGFNSYGAERVERILRRSRKPTVPLGINIGKTKVVPIDEAVGDYLHSFTLLYPHGHYFVINVSSPNTPNLRELQDKDKLLDLATQVQGRNSLLAKKLGIAPKPVFVKIAPDLTFSQIDDVLEVIQETNCAGIIATNTTIDRSNIKTKIDEQGGLSGKPLRKRSTEIIRYIYKKTNGKIPIIGVGGVFKAKDAYEKIKAGASLVQVYTGFIYEGPSCLKNINKGLVAMMRRDKIKNISQAVGLDVRRSTAAVVLSSPEKRHAHVEKYKEKLRDVDAIVATVPGIALAACLAQETQKPMVYLRTKKKKHGTGKQIEGRLLSNSRVSMIIDKEGREAAEQIVKENQCTIENGVLVDGIRRISSNHKRSIILDANPSTAEGIANILLSIKAVKLNVKKPFVYVSGIKSPIYCDNRLLPSYPKEWKQVIDGLLHLIKTKVGEVDIIAGTATAGISHAAAVAHRLHLPMVIVDKDQIEGSFKKGKRVVIIEDLVSTGKSSIATLQALRKHGAEVKTCLAIFTYELPKAKKWFAEEKCELFTLSNFTTLIKQAVKEKYITQKEKTVALKWNKNPDKWKK